MTGPDGKIYYGNQFDASGFSTAFSAPDITQYDRKNNVEVVEINPATTGTIEVDVNGYNVPDGPQPFALVVEGGVESQVSCDFFLTPSSAEFTSSANSGSFGVNCNDTCSWTPVSNSSWITTTSPGGEGPGTVSYSVASNPAPTPRAGSISAGGQTFQVTQDAAPANFSMSMTQEGQTVTLKAAFLLGDIPMVRVPVTFYDQKGSGSYAKKRTVKTDASGVATLKFTAALGAHSAYATHPQVTNSTAGTIQAQSTPAMPYTIGKVPQTSPANGAAITTLPVALSWDTSLYPDATDYEVQVNSRAAFPAALKNYSVTASPSISYTSTMLPGTSTFWRVRAVLPTGHSLYSPTWKFKYKPVPVLGLSVTPYSATKVTLTATVTDGSGNVIRGRKVFFYDNGALKGSAVTKPDGTAIKTIAGTSGDTAQIQFKGDSMYSAAAPVSATLP